MQVNKKKSAAGHDISTLEFRNKDKSKAEREF
jgi:hypothetical protein